MSFHILKEELSFIDNNEGTPSKKGDLFQLIPSEQLLSELPYSKHLDIKPINYLQYIKPFLESILNFDIQSSDVFVCSLPKCGSSWMQTIVWLLKHDLNYEAAKTLNRLEQLRDFDEIEKIKTAKAKAQDLLKNDASNSLSESDAHKMAWNDVFKALDTSRVFKTHQPIYFLPKAIWSKGAKVIYVVRNPKDMIVSLYHYLRNTFHFEFSIDDYVDGMTRDTWGFSPMLNHILNFWRVKHLPNILFVSYENLVTNAFASIKKISEFLECNYTDEELKELTEYISFDNMKKNKAINREEDVRRLENEYGKRLDSEFTFLRKGKVGGYRDDLNDDQVKKIDDWIRNGLKDSDLRFKI